jgi:hypothetical protein
METAFRNAFKANQKNTADFLAGKITPQLQARVERLYIRGLLPATTPAGILIDEGTKQAFLSSYKLTDFPAKQLLRPTSRRSSAVCRFVRHQR